MAVIIDDEHPHIGDDDFAHEVLRARHKGIAAGDIEVKDITVDYAMFHDWSQGRNLPDQAARRKLMPVLKEINRSL